MISKSDQKRIDEEQTKACRRLLWAVVEQAVRDACLTPLRGRPARPQEESLTAMRFFFDKAGSGLAEYAVWLDVYPDVFKQKLLEFMHDDSSFTKGEYSDIQRRNFRWNYRYWCQHNHEKHFYRKEREDQNDGPKQIWTTYHKTPDKTDGSAAPQEGKPARLKPAEPARVKSGVARKLKEQP